VRARDAALHYVLRGIVQRGPAGSQPTLYVQLADYRRAIGRPGSINQVLVANRGDASDSVLLSTQVAQALRVALADRRAAKQIFDRLRSDSARAEIAAAARATDGRPRQKLERLVAFSQELARES
jgi:hypothetical protein